MQIRQSPRPPSPTQRRGATPGWHFNHCAAPGLLQAAVIAGSAANNAFSEKLEKLEAAVALHFAPYNFVRIHQTLRVTPAMAGGLNHPFVDDDRLAGADAVKPSEPNAL